MKREICAAALVLQLASTAAFAEIPDIDSSDWATDPRAYGMSAKEYIQAESRAFFADFIGRAGLNSFFHFPGVAAAEDRFVVSPNNDTVYSVAIVNVSEGFTLELPDVGDRFLSIQIIDENHMTPSIFMAVGPTRSRQISSRPPMSALASAPEPMHPRPMWPSYRTSCTRSTGSSGRWTSTRCQGPILTC